jgi:hypothetical protein
MRSRTLAVGAFLACALTLSAQQQPSLYKIEGVTGASMVALGAPVIVGNTYAFAAWPDGAFTQVPQARVKRITQLVGWSAATVYRIDLVPSGVVLAKDNPTLKGNTYVFHVLRGGALTSLRKSDVKGIRPVTGDEAFWIEQRMAGEVTIQGPLAMEGGSQVYEIGTPSQTPSSQAGPQSMSQISGAPTYGNWQYQGTPGTSDAYGPANATMSSGVPTMPAATDGSAPPTQPDP